MRAEAGTGGRDAWGLAGKVAEESPGARGKGLLHQGRELSNGFVGHGEPVKAVEQGQPWACESARSRGLFNGG